MENAAPCSSCGATLHGLYCSVCGLRNDPPVNAGLDERSVKTEASLTKTILTAALVVVAGLVLFTVPALGAASAVLSLLVWHGKSKKLQQES